jgi:hypothetical protein
MAIHWWPRVELEENRPTIDRTNRRMGYCLQWAAIGAGAKDEKEPTAD